MIFIYEKCNIVYTVNEEMEFRSVKSEILQT